MSLSVLVADAGIAQKNWALVSRGRRVLLLESYAQHLQQSRQQLAEILAQDARKTAKDAQSEVDAAIESIHKTIRDTTMPELGDMVREKIRPSVGIVGLITSFNFPMVVAHWTIAPALLAGNAVIWKPSEKTPRVALLCKEIFDAVAGDHKNILQLLQGDRQLGAAMVADEGVDMIAATGSVMMGESIARMLAAKKNNKVPPLLELGGNNALVIAASMSDAHLAFAVDALMSSFLGSTGQRCTNTRRLIVHEAWFDKTLTQIEQWLRAWIASGSLRDPENIYGYNRLIDAQAEAQFDAAKMQAVKEGGRLLFGGEGEPALAIMPEQTAVMHTETFAPLLYIVPYRGTIEAAMQLVNAPENAGLVNGVYTLSQAEADQFVALNEAGHSVINSPKGTGTPAFGMGFGGNKASGVGEILWSNDPLAAFTRPHPAKRVAVNKTIALQ